MIKTLLVAGIAAFVGKKLYDKGVLDPYIAEARKQMKTSFPDTKANSDGSAADDPASYTPPHVVPVG